MKVLTAGHKYELDNFEAAMAVGNDAEVSPDGKIRSFQTIQFIEKTPTSDGGTSLETVHNGTTNEEVLTVLIDRFQFLNAKFPCKENAVALSHIETALLWLNKRTADRKARNVEGTHQK